MSAFTRITLVRAMYRVEWLLMLNGTDNGLISWLKTVEYLENRAGRHPGFNCNSEDQDND